MLMHCGTKYGDSQVLFSNYAFSQYQSPWEVIGIGTIIYIVKKACQTKDIDHCLVAFDYLDEVALLRKVRLLHEMAQD